MTKKFRNEMLKKRREALYNYIINRNVPVSIEEIIMAIPYYRVAKASSHDPCPAVCTDIHAINNDSNFEKIIVIDNFTYYVPNKEQADDYLNSLWESIKARLYRFYKIKHKALLNDQGKFDEEATLKYIESLRK